MLVFHLSAMYVLLKKSSTIILHISLLGFYVCIHTTCMPSAPDGQN